MCLQFSCCSSKSPSILKDSPAFVILKEAERTFNLCRNCGWFNRRPCLLFIIAIGASEIDFRIFFFFLWLLAALNECEICFDVRSSISDICQVTNAKKLQKLVVCSGTSLLPNNAFRPLDFSFSVWFFQKSSFKWGENWKMDVVGKNLLFLLSLRDFVITITIESLCICCLSHVQIDGYISVFEKPKAEATCRI